MFSPPTNAGAVRLPSKRVFDETSYNCRTNKALTHSQLQHERSQSATLIHVAWTCPQYADASHTEDTWESLLHITDSAQQRRVISRALEAAVSQGIPADLL